MELLRKHQMLNYTTRSSTRMNSPLRSSIKKPSTITSNYANINIMNISGKSTDKIVYTPLKVEEDDIDSMSDEEIKKAIFSMAGKWVGREDITEDWVEDMRKQSDDRLADILNLA